MLWPESSAVLFLCSGGCYVIVGRRWGLHCNTKGHQSTHTHTVDYMTQRRVCFFPSAIHYTVVSGHFCLLIAKLRIIYSDALGNIVPPTLWLKVSRIFVRSWEPSCWTSSSVAELFHHLFVLLGHCLLSAPYSNLIVSSILLFVLFYTWTPVFLVRQGWRKKERTLFFCDSIWCRFTSRVKVWKTAPGAGTSTKAV